MALIVDTHAHVHPYLGSASGRDSLKRHMQHLQHHVLFHYQGFRRRAGGSPVKKQMLFDGVNDGLSGLREVSFRVGRFGQLEWTCEGEDYYIQWMPPSLQNMECPPEFMIAQMDYVGVNMAVLQHDHPYGDLNEYLGECVKKYPNRFIGLVQVNEWEADKESEIDRLRDAVKKLGLKGLYFDLEGYCVSDFKDRFNDEKFLAFWEEVHLLRIPVFWAPYTGRLTRIEDYREQYRRIAEFAREHPDVPCVVTHGVETFAMIEGENRFKIFPEVKECLRNSNVLLEVLFHMMVPDKDYPFSELREPLRELCEEFGARKLMWGSDMPAVERNCTYRQSLDWLRRRCEFISSKDMDLILGGNTARLFGF